MFDIKETSVGKGLFSKRDVPKGCRVCEFTGDYLSHDSESSCYHIGVSDELVMDPNPPYRFINHCCDPNCEFVVEFLDESMRKINGVYLDALRDIKAGDELRTDYAWPMEDDCVPCRCGSGNCRGWIVDKDLLKAN